MKLMTRLRNLTMAALANGAAVPVVAGADLSGTPQANTLRR